MPVEIWKLEKEFSNELRFYILNDEGKKNRKNCFVNVKK